MYLIEIEHLYKSYGSLSVLCDLSLRIAEGETYGLLGTHGAGKSTLLHVLLGFLKPVSGKARLLGKENLEAARRLVGYIPERQSYHLRYSTREYLSFLGMFSNMTGTILRRRVEEQIKRVGLSGVADRRLSTLPRGMLQRVGIAQALLTNPELLLLDDPLSTLDTTEQRAVADVLLHLRTEGYTMLICSHYTPTLTQLCDRIGVLAEGAIVDEIDTQSLRTASSNIRIHVDQLTPGLRIQLSSISPAIDSQNHTVTLSPNTQQLQNRVLRALLDAGVTILGLESLDHPLEQFYQQAIERAPHMPSKPATGAQAMPWEVESSDQHSHVSGNLLSEEEPGEYRPINTDDSQRYDV
jgi:ABC-2 type transport system ATP-binding protein